MPTRALSAPPARPATNTWPSVALSVPATSFRMVDLPQPEGPTRATNSPWLMRNEVSASAVTWFFAPPNVTRTFSRSMTFPTGSATASDIVLAFFAGGDRGHGGVGIFGRRRRHPLNGMDRAAGAAGLLVQHAVLHDKVAAHDGVDRQRRAFPTLPGRDFRVRLDLGVVDGPAAVHVNDRDVRVGADRQRTLARIESPKLGRIVRAPAHIVADGGAAAIDLRQHQRHLGLDAGKAAIDGPDIVAGFLFRRVRGVISCHHVA